MTLYSIHKKTDGSGDVYYVPALQLDTLKISTVDKTADSTWAQGGKGNSRLINWDSNKQINVSLQDALCSPASLALCWSGILSADWKNGQIDINTDACSCKNPLNRVDRMEPCIYPRTSNDPTEHLVSRLLPQTGVEGFSMDLLNKSEIVDGTRVQGVGQVAGHSYKWRLIIESGVRSIAQVPDRFFDFKGRSYPINWNSKVSVFNGEAPTYSNFKDAIIYKIGDAAQGNKAHPYIIFDAWMDNHGDQGVDGVTMSLQDYLTQYSFNASTEGTLVEPDGKDSANVAHNVPYSDHSAEELSIREAKYLAIVVDNNNKYHAFVGNGDKTSGAAPDTSTDSHVAWYAPKEGVITSQFEGLDMWIRFSGINALTYFILTKYGEDILRIAPAFRAKPGKEYRLMKSTKSDDTWSDFTPVGTWSETVPTVPAETDTTRYRLDTREPEATVNAKTTVIEEYDETSDEMGKFEGKLWAYVNPRTMQPYDDDYWFHYQEPYYVKSLTIAPKSKQIKGNKIVVKADQWPGMYMAVGETYIRNRDTGEDERMQIKFPLCKVKSEQTITLEAGGEPTVFNMTLEVAKPRSGAMMEINTYAVATKMVEGENGCYYAIDGSSQVLSE